MGWRKGEATLVPPQSIAGQQLVVLCEIMDDNSVISPSWFESIKSARVFMAGAGRLVKSPIRVALTENHEF